MNTVRKYLLLAVLGLCLLFYYWKKAGPGPLPGPAPAPVPVSAEPFDRNESSYIFTRHARCRMDCRHIDESEIREIVHKGTINFAKSDPDGRPDPKYALEGTTHDGQKVRLIIAPSQKGLVVVTVIDLDREWACDCK